MLRLHLLRVSRENAEAIREMARDEQVGQSEWKELFDPKPAEPNPVIEEPIHPVSVHHKRNFRRLGIKPGQELYFIPDSSYTVTAAQNANSSMVHRHWDGKTTSLHVASKDAFLASRGYPGRMSAYESWAMKGSNVPLSGMPLVSN